MAMESPTPQLMSPASTGSATAQAPSAQSLVSPVSGARKSRRVQSRLDGLAANDKSQLASGFQLQPAPSALPSESVAARAPAAPHVAHGSAVPELPFPSTSRAHVLQWMAMRPSTTPSAGESLKLTLLQHEACDAVLRRDGDQPLSLVTIFGLARQGKSTLMNMLAGMDVFPTSASFSPCTNGVFLSSTLRRLAVGPEPTSECPTAPLVGFLDTEGQGDKSEEHDVQLVTPALLVSQVVLLNWMGNFQKTKMLDQLALLTKAAQNVVDDTCDAEMEDDGDDALSREERKDAGEPDALFGHLIIVMRDWKSEGTEQQVRDLLMKRERGRRPDVINRNNVRALLQDSFQSVSVHFLPSNEAAGFRTAVDSLRARIAPLTQSPGTFNGRPLDGHAVADIMPHLVHASGSSELDLAPMWRHAAAAAHHRTVTKLASRADAALASFVAAQGGDGAWLSARRLEQEEAEVSRHVLASLPTAKRARLLPDADVAAEVATSLRDTRVQVGCTPAADSEVAHPSDARRERRRGDVLGAETEKETDGEEAGIATYARALRANNDRKHSALCAAAKTAIMSAIVEHASSGHSDVPDAAALTAAGLDAARAAQDAAGDGSDLASTLLQGVRSACSDAVLRALKLRGLLENNMQLFLSSLGRGVDSLSASTLNPALISNAYKHAVALHVSGKQEMAVATAWLPVLSQLPSVQQALAQLRADISAAHVAQVASCIGACARDAMRRDFNQNLDTLSDAALELVRKRSARAAQWDLGSSNEATLREVRRRVRKAVGVALDVKKAMEQAVSDAVPRVYKQLLSQDGSAQWLCPEGLIDRVANRVKQHLEADIPGWGAAACVPVTEGCSTPREYTEQERAYCRTALQCFRQSDAVTSALHQVASQNAETAAKELSRVKAARAVNVGAGGRLPSQEELGGTGMDAVQGKISSCGEQFRRRVKVAAKAAARDAAVDLQAKKRQSGSTSGSKSGSKPGSKPCNKPTSKQGSEPGSKPGSIRTGDPGWTVYQGIGRPRNSDYRPDGTRRHAEDKDVRAALAAASAPPATIHRGRGRPRKTDYRPDGTRPRAKDDGGRAARAAASAPAATIYRGRGRPRNSDYRPDGSLRRNR